MLIGVALVVWCMPLSTMGSVPMIVCILCVALMQSFMALSQSTNSWLPLVIVLAFLGGLMILFMYMISISPQYKYKNKSKLGFALILMLVLGWNMSEMEVSSTSSKISYSLNWALFSFMALVIFFSLITCSKVILNPFKCLKASF